MVAYFRLGRRPRDIRCNKRAIPARLLLPLPWKHPGHLTGIVAAWRGRRVLLAAVSQWVDRLAAAHRAGNRQAELVRFDRCPPLVIDEVGWIPFGPEFANLFFLLVSSRYERASLIVTSNKPFGPWAEVFGDDTAAAMIARIVRHADVLALEGTSCRLKERGLGRSAATDQD